MKTYYSKHLGKKVTIPDNVTPEKAEVLQAYNDRLNETLDRLERLEAYCKNGFGVDENTVNWATIGSIGHVNEQLMELEQFAYDRV